MTLFYGRNASTSSDFTKYSWIPHAKCVRSAQLACPPLGISTKTHANIGAQGIERVHNFLLQDQSAKLLPKERVCNCLKKRIDKKIDRLVKYNQGRKKSHWSNVQRCGSVWICPVCAKQITEKRREELKKGCDAWKAKGGSVLLLTLTNSHSSSHRLSDLIAGQKKAIKRFFEGRRGVYLLNVLGRKYQIRSFEVTYGQNGWHPHFHILLFIDGSFNADMLKFDIREELAKFWINCCVNSGLPAPDMKHGLDLRSGHYADKYVSKWGIEHELTKGHVKKGRNGGFTPFDLLQLSISDDLVYGKSSGTLFQEFAISFKGARQLVWARGLKKLLGIEEKTDEELAEETEQNAIDLRSVDNYLFSLLCKFQKRHEFLETLERDYENGCFGSGETELLMIDLYERELRFLEVGSSDFSCVKPIGSDERPSNKISKPTILNSSQAELRFL